MRRLTTIMPALVIGVLCFFASLSVFTAWHSRRCRRQRSLMQNVALAGEVDRRHTKKKKRVVRRPRLFEVHLGTPQRDADLEALLPVAAELPSGCDPSKLSSLVVVPEKERRRPWYLPRFPQAPQPPTPTNLPVVAEDKPPTMQQAQLAFLVSMPTAPGQSASELMLGTTRLPYQCEPDGDDEAEDLLKKIEWTV